MAETVIKKIVGIAIFVSLFSGSAFAGPVGKYKYTEEGYSGTMSVSEVSGCKFKNELGCLSSRIYKVEISTIAKGTGHDCSVTAIENSYARISSSSSVEVLFVTEEKYENKAKQFSVRFELDGAAVKPEGQNLSSLCGTGVYFTGKWLKAVAATNLAAKSSDTQNKISDYEFAMPPDWLILPQSNPHDDLLLFRRFSVALYRKDYEDVRSGKADQFQAVGRAGTFYNSMSYSCQRDRRKSDFLTFHLPEEVSPVSFKRDAWISKLEVRMLGDNVGMKTNGEYIKGDLFVDASSFGDTADFLKILTVSDLIVEFGDNNDRLNLFIGGGLGKTKLVEYVQEVLPLMLKLKPSSIRFMNSFEVIRVCVAYKRTGRF